MDHQVTLRGKKIKYAVQALTMVDKATSLIIICELSTALEETRHVVTDGEEERMYVSSFIKMQSSLCIY